LTQLQSLQAVPSSGRRSFTLQVRDKLGQGQKAVYSSQEPGGIARGFASRRYPSGTCGPLTFQGKPSELDIENGDITYLSYDTGQRVIPVHMGVVVLAPFEDGPEWGTYEVASGKKLLERSVCGADADIFWATEADIAATLHLLIQDYRHPALKYDGSSISISFGVVVRSFDARGTNLDEAIKAALKAVPAISDNDWGVGPLGNVIIRPPEGVVTLPYRQVKAQFGGSISSDEVVTKATIRVANAVSEGAIVSAGYKPSLITYSYEAPEHRLWGAERSFDLEKTDDGRAVIDVLIDTPSTGLGYGSGVNGWQASTAEVYKAVADGNLETYIYPGSSNPGLLAITAFKGEDFAGSAFAIDAPPGAYEIRLEIFYQYSPNQGGSNRETKETVKFDLSRIKGLGKIRIPSIAPMAVGAANIVNVNFVYAGSLPTSLKIYEFRSLQANTTLLDKIARAQIKLPARELAEIECAYGPEGENGSLLERVGKTFVAEGAPTPITGTIAEIVDTFNTEDGMRSRIALGEPVRDPVVKSIQRFVRGTT